MKTFLHGPFAAAHAPPRLPLPVMVSKVQAGFPSPAEDWAEERADLNWRYVHHPETTFSLRCAAIAWLALSPSALFLLVRC